MKPVEYIFKSAIVDKEKRIVSGLVTVEKSDRERDIIDIESVKTVFKSYMRNPVVLVHHDIKRPVAKVTDHKDDISKSMNPGIRIWTQHGFSKDPSSDVETSWELIEQGILNGFSGRFKPAYFKQEPNGRRVIVKELLEVSYVTVTGNDETLIDTIVKSLDPIDQTEVDDTINDELIKSLFSNLKTELLSEMDNRINAKFEGIEQTLGTIKKSLPEPPNEEEEKMKSFILDTLTKAMADETQLSELKKALGPSQDDGEGSDGSSSSSSEDEKKDHELQSISKGYQSAENFGMEAFSKLVNEGG